MADLKERIYEVSKELQLLNVATITEDGKPWVRYVVGSADEGLTFRFCTNLQARKVKQIQKNPSVHISLGASDLESARNWLQVAGTAAVSTDSTERHDFWFDELSNYFEGPDDPNYCIVIIKPETIEFGTMGNMTPEIWTAA